MPLPCHNALREEVVREIERLPAMLPAEPSMVAAAIGAAAIAAVAAVYLVSRPPNLHRYDPDEYGRGFDGIRGWLVVLSIVVAIEPLRVAFVARCNLFLLSQEMWSLLVDFRWPLGNEWGSTMILWYAVVPAMQLVFAVAIAVALFLRRRSFRALALGYLVGVMLLLVVEAFVLTQVFGDLSEVLTEQFRLQERWLMITFVGVAYLLASRRVHATFRR